MLNTEKLRNVYCRHDVLHVCFNGFLVGPAKDSESSIPAGAEVRVQPIAKAGGLVFEVYMPGRGRRKAVRETWVATKVPGDGRRPTKDRVEPLLETE